jgi:hypothetical protein
MPKQQNILIAGRDPATLNQIAEVLEANDCVDVSKRLLVNGDNDPLQDLDEKPAILILGLTNT